MCVYCAVSGVHVQHLHHTNRLYAQFFKEIQNGVVCFMDTKVFGRSPLEASSFIVSSAFPDKTLWGSGFLARLSGLCSA